MKALPRMKAHSATIPGTSRISSTRSPLSTRPGLVRGLFEDKRAEASSRIPVNLALISVKREADLPA
jgi:hypothetical protein